MLVLPKMMRILSYGKFRHQIGLLKTKNILQVYERSLHVNVNLCVKMYLEKENQHAYQIMENKGYAKSLKIKTIDRVLSEEEFEHFSRENWSKASKEKIFETFALLGKYCSDNNICISNKIFDDFIDNLTDNIQNASDEELESLFYSLMRWPETESVRTRNYIEVWAALDAACLSRVNIWSFDETLQFVSLFFMLNVTKSSDFCVKSINKLATKAKRLTPGQLIQTMFFIGVLRKQPHDMFNLEVHAIDHFKDLTLDDLAIMSMGFFKSKTPIRHMEFLSQIAEKIIENPKGINEVSLAALLKVLRYSVKMTKDDMIYRLLDTLQHEVPRLSVMCNVHLALLGTSTLTLHKDCLTKIADKLINSLESARIKDIERLVLTYGTLNFIPPTNESLFEKILVELRKPEREKEIQKHRRSFVCCVNYLSLLGIHPVDLMNKILSPDFLKETYSGPYTYGREILNIHNTSLIFYPDIEMNRLSDKTARIMAKNYTDYIPNKNYKKQYNITERMMLDIIETLEEDRGEGYVIGDHIVTHHQRGDIIVCNGPNGKPLHVKDVFRSETFGLLRKPPDDNQWIVLVLAGRNALIHGTDTPAGIFITKIQELRALGFRAVMVPWSVYGNMKTKKEKSHYLSKLINDAT